MKLLYSVLFALQVMTISIRRGVNWSVIYSMTKLAHSSFMRKGKVPSYLALVRNDILCYLRILGVLENIKYLLEIVETCEHLEKHDSKYKGIKDNLVPKII